MERMLDSSPDPITGPGIVGKSLDFSRSPSKKKAVNHLQDLSLFSQLVIPVITVRFGHMSMTKLEIFAIW